MRPGNLKPFGAALSASGVLLFALGVGIGRGDEPGRFGRLFRLGGSASNAGVTTQPPPAGAPTFEPVGANVPAPMSLTTTAPAPGAMPPQSQPRLRPQPRVSRPITDADPIVTRVSLGRSDDGRQFGMFLQVFADGTVIDSEGVHQTGRQGIKDVMAALEQGDLYRVRGHCGAPSTDFVEQVHMVVYERSLGRLKANAFSFSGNPQGCDHAVRHLQTVLDALQARLSQPSPGSAMAPNPRPANPGSPPPLSLNGGVAPLP